VQSIVRSCDVVVSYSGTQPRWIRSHGDTGGTNDVEGRPQRHAKRSGKQTRESTKRQTHQHSTASSVLTSDESCAAAICQNDFCHSAVGRAEGGAGGQKKSQSTHKSFVKPSKDKLSASPQTSSFTAGAGTQSPAMPHSSSLNHRLPQSVPLSAV